MKNPIREHLQNQEEIRYSLDMIYVELKNLNDILEIIMERYVYA